MTEEQKKLIAQMLADNAGNKLTLELIEGIYKRLQKIMEDTNGS